MLAYVYGVVPVSLCRSGGCGVTTSDGGGVRIEFDDDNDAATGITSNGSGRKQIMKAHCYSYILYTLFI